MLRCQLDCSFLSATAAGDAGSNPVTSLYNRKCSLVVKTLAAKETTKTFTATKL